MTEHTFVIRIWNERREIEGAPPEYRGVIQHVSSGNKRYLKKPDAVFTFMAPYLEEMGVDLDVLRKMRSWLKRPKPPLKEI